MFPERAPSPQADPSQDVNSPEFKAAKLADIKQRESGGRNVPNAQGGPAAGYYQFMPDSWKEGLQLAGFHTDAYDTPLSAPEAIQDRVASAFYDKYGEKPWIASAKGPIAPPPGKPVAPISQPEQDPFLNFNDRLNADLPGQELPASTGSWAITRGLASGLRGLRQTGIQLHAIADKIMGDENGMRDLMSVNNMLERENQAAAPAKDFHQLIHDGSVGEWLEWLAYNAGEQVPNLAMLVGTDGVGTLAGYATRLGVRAVARGTITELAEKEALSKFMQRGGLVGAYLGASGQASGQIAAEQYQAINDIRPGVAIGAGLVAGVPGVIAPAAIGSALGLTPKLAAGFAETMRAGITDIIGSGFLRRRLAGAVAYGGEFAGASAIQAAVMDAARAYVDAHYEFLGPESANRILDAAASGALNGATFGFAIPAMPRDLVRHLNWAANKDRDPTFKPTAFVETKSDDPRLMKAFPGSESNPAISEVYKGIRQAIVEDGGFDKLSKVDQEAILSKSPTLEDLEPLMLRVERLVHQNFMGTDQVSDNGVPMKISNSTIDLKNQNYELYDHNNPAETKTIPLGDLPIAQLTMQAMKDHPGPLGELVPKGGITDGRGQFMPPHVDGLHMSLYNFMQRYAGSDFRDRLGNPVDMKNPMKPGQVVYAKDAADPAKLNPRQKRWLEVLLRKLAPGAKLILDEHSMSPEHTPGAAGWFMHLGDQHYVIHIGDIDDEAARKGTTLAHELGHLLFWHHFNSASIAQQLAIYNTYHSTWKGITDNNLLDVMRKYARPEMMSWVHHNLYTAERMKKWWDFDEFGAEQFAKYLAGKRGTALDKFFGGAAAKWKTMIEGFKDQRYDLNPNEVLANWFDRLHSRGSTGMDILAESVLKSVMANAKILSEKLDPADSVLDRVAKSPPQMPENEALDAAADKGLIPRKIRAQADKFTWFAKHIWNIMQVAKLNPDVIHLGNISNYLQMFYARRMNWSIDADKNLIKSNALGKERQRMLSRLEVELDLRRYLKKDEPPRWPNPVEMKKIIVNIGMKGEDWAAIKPVYEERRDLYTKVLKVMELSVIARARATITDQASLAAKITEISNQMNALRAGPYMPHSRYGDYGINVRDGPTGKRLHMELFWTQRQAEKAGKISQERYRAQGYPNAVFEFKPIPHEVRQWIGLPPALLDQIRLMPGITPEQHEWIDHLRFEVSPENSFAKRFIKRTGLPGYDMNSDRSFANYFSSASGHLARLEFQGPLQEELKNLRASSLTDFGPQDPRRFKRMEIADWADKQIQYILHPPNEAAALRSFAFQWWLGYNPSTAFVHLMQMPLFTAPYMSKYWGMGSIPRLLSTYGELRSIYRGTGGKLEPALEKGLERAVRDGFMTENRGIDLATWTEYGLLGRSAQGTAYQRYLKQFLNKTGSILRLVEGNNRRVTFVANWREAMRDPANPRLQDLVNENRLIYNKLLGEGESPQTAAAYIAGRDSVQSTHFSYTQVARPEFMRGKMSGIMTFMSYKQQALYFFLHNPAGRRALAMVAVTSGLRGMPFEEDLDYLIKTISEWIFGKRFDPNEEITKIAGELTDHPEVLMHGLGRDQLGMPHLFNSLGIPWLLGDFSRRLGYGEMIPGLAEATKDQQETFMERFGNTVAGALGAGLEVPIQVGKVMQDLNVPYTLQKMLEQGVSWQNVRGLEWVMPSVIRNSVEAARYIAQGGDVDPRGVMQYPIDIHDSEGQSAAIERLLGFSPTPITRGAEVRDTTAQVKAFWTIRKARAIQDFVNARTMGDPEAIADTLANVRSYNEEAPVPQLRIRPQGLVDAIKTRRKEQVQQITPLERTILPQYPEYQEQLQRTGILPSPQG